MTIPLNIQLAKLPPIITFFTSNIHAGDAFPLSIGIFVNGKSYAWHITPKNQWKLDHYDPEIYGNTPLSFFYDHGNEPQIIKAAIEKLIGFQKVIFVLNPASDKYSLKQIGCTELIVKDIEEIDTFDHHGDRMQQLIKTIKDSKLNIYSIKDVVQTLAYQTCEKLLYQDLDLLKYTLFRYSVDHSK